MPVPTPARSSGAASFGGSLSASGGKSGGSSPRAGSPREGEDSAFVLCAHCLCANPRNFATCRSCKKKNSGAALAASPVSSPSSSNPATPQSLRRSALRPAPASADRRKSVSELDEDDESQ